MWKWDRETNLGYFNIHILFILFIDQYKVYFSSGILQNNGRNILWKWHSFMNSNLSAKCYWSKFHWLLFSAIYLQVFRASYFQKNILLILAKLDLPWKMLLYHLSPDIFSVDDSLLQKVNRSLSFIHSFQENLNPYLQSCVLELPLKW